MTKRRQRWLSGKNNHECFLIWLVLRPGQSQCNLWVNCLSTVLLCVDNAEVTGLVDVSE